MQPLRTRGSCWRAVSNPLSRIQLVARAGMPPRQHDDPTAPAPGRPLINPLSVTFVAGSTMLVGTASIPNQDLIFSVAWPAYLLAMNTWRFKSNAALQNKPPGPLVAENWVRLYAAGAAVLAILLPAVLCLLNFRETTVLRLVAPHLYLTMVQVLCEYCTRGNHVAMLPRMLVPIGFNTYRM